MFFSFQKYFKFLFGVGTSFVICTKLQIIAHTMSLKMFSGFSVFLYITVHYRQSVFIPSLSHSIIPKLIYFSGIPISINR